MFRWIPYPFVRIALFFVLGIILAIFRPEFVPGDTVPFLFAGCCIVFFLLTIMRTRINLNPGIFGLTAIFLAGYLNVQLHRDGARADHILNTKAPGSYYKAIITRPPEERAKSWRMDGKYHRC